MPKRKPVVVVTRRLPEVIETRMRELFDRQRKAFDAAPFPDLASRKANLRKLIAALQKHQNDVVAAVNADFGVRAGAETRLVEVMGPILEAHHCLSHLRKWMKPRRLSASLRKPSAPRLYPKRSRSRFASSGS
jgi:coniferyl-aldehyde dehydrogenase